MVIHDCIYIYIHIQIYMYRYMSMYIYVCTCMYIVYIHICATNCSLRQFLSLPAWTPHSPSARWDTGSAGNGSWQRRKSRAPRTGAPSSRCFHERWARARFRARTGHFAKRFGGHFDVQLRFFDPGKIFCRQCLVVVFAPGLCRGRTAAAAGSVLFARIVCE